MLFLLINLNTNLDKNCCESIFIPFLLIVPFRVLYLGSLLNVSTFSNCCWPGITASLRFWPFGDFFKCFLVSKLCDTSTGKSAEIYLFKNDCLFWFWNFLTHHCKCAKLYMLDFCGKTALVKMHNSFNRWINLAFLGQQTLICQPIKPFCYRSSGKCQNLPV